MKKNNTLKIIEFKSLGLVSEFSFFTIYQHNFKFSDGQCITMRIQICEIEEHTIFDLNKFFYINKYLLNENSIEINTDNDWLWNEEEKVDDKYIKILTGYWGRFHEKYCTTLSLDDYGCMLIKEDELNELLSRI